LIWQQEGKLGHAFIRALLSVYNQEELGRSWGKEERGRGAREEWERKANENEQSFKAKYLILVDGRG